MKLLAAVLPAALFLALLSASMAVPAGCTHTPPIVEPLTTCGSNVVTAANIRRVEQDLSDLGGGGEADLISWIATDGPGFVACIVEWYVQNGTSVQKAAASRFKTGHKAQLAGPTGGGGG